MNRLLRILIVTDALLPPARGNGTTVSRWIEGLARRGHRVDAIEPGRDPLAAGEHDVVLGYHADRCGPHAAALARRLAIPLVVSLGGTDLLELERCEATPGRDALARADVITAAFATARARVANRLGREIRFAVVRRGVFRDPEFLRERPTGRPRVVLPAGLRRVKDPMLALEMLRTLRVAGIDLVLEVLGAALEADYAEAFAAAARRLGGVVVGQRPPFAMGAAYATALAAWNTSLHEGGANGILEAAALGCGILVRDTPGNRELADEEGSPITVFAPGDDARLIAWHRDLIAENSATRAARHDATMAWLARWHDPQDEILDLERALTTAVGDRPPEVEPGRRPA